MERVHWRDLTNDFYKVTKFPWYANEVGVYSAAICLGQYRAVIEQSSRVINFQGARFEHIDVARYEGFGFHEVNRSIHHIRCDQRKDYLLSIPLQAQVSVFQNGARSLVGPDSYILVSTSKPFSASSSAIEAGSEFAMLHLRISGVTLRAQVPYVDEYCDRPIRLRAGASAIMKAMSQMAITEGPALSRSQSLQFESMLINSIASALTEAPELLALPIHSINPAHLSMWRQAKAFIEMNLSNPALNAQLVATHCGVSKRYLHQCFCESGQTIVGLIRELRLLRCQQDLRQPASRSRSIAQTAMDWGFNDIPHFCRAYKARFGVSPGRDRQLEHLNNTGLR